MSRIILSRYETGGHHWVVGWDHPARGCFWQEWASPSEIAHAEQWLEMHEDVYDEPDPSGAALRYLSVVETGVKAEGGMWPGIPLGLLYEQVPEELQALLREKQVLDTLQQHALDPNSGRTVLDLTKWEER